MENTHSFISKWNFLRSVGCPHRKKERQKTLKTWISAGTGHPYCAKGKLCHPWWDRCKLLCGCGCPGLSNYRPQKFLSFFLGKLLKTKPFPRNILTKRWDIPSKKKSFYMKYMYDSFNCRSVYVIFEESFPYRNKLEVWGQERKL